MPLPPDYRSIPALSVSVIDSFLRCPRKFFFSFGLMIGSEEHLALKFGEAIHAGIPHAFFGDVDAAMTAFMLVWQDRQGDDMRNPDNARGILRNYSEAHSGRRSLYTFLPPPAGSLKVSDKISDYEIPFALDIGLPIPFVGRIDGLGRHRDTDEPWVLEFKTTRELSARFMDSFDMNPQVIGYTMVLRAMGVPVRGAFVEGLKVSKAIKDRYDCMCKPVFVSDKMIADFIILCKYVYWQIKAMETAGDFPLDLSACTPYPQFGMPGYQCEYLSMCRVDDWTTLRSMFKPKDYPTFRLLQPTLNGESLGRELPTSTPNLV